VLADSEDDKRKHTFIPETKSIRRSPSFLVMAHRMPRPSANFLARRSITATASSSLVNVGRSWYLVTASSEKMAEIAWASVRTVSLKISRGVCSTGNEVSPDSGVKASILSSVSSPRLFHEFTEGANHTVGTNKASYWKSLSVEVIPDAPDTQTLRGRDIPFQIITHHPSAISSLAFTVLPVPAAGTSSARSRLLPILREAI
jgi:hypothetical protein